MIANLIVVQERLAISIGTVYVFELFKAPIVVANLDQRSATL